MRRLVLWTIPLLFALGTVGFLVAFFVLAYSASLTPGPSPEQADAAGISLLGAFISGLLTTGACFVAAMAEDEL